MTERSQFVNALLGAAVTIVLAFIPFSSVLGGAVAGYLQGGELRDGLRIGALSGALAAVPMFILFGFMAAIFGVGLLGVGAPRLLAFGGLFVIAVFLFSMVYLVGLSALGGVVGAAIEGEPGVDPRAEG